MIEIKLISPSNMRADDVINFMLQVEGVRIDSISSKLVRTSEGTKKCFWAKGTQVR